MQKKYINIIGKISLFLSILLSFAFMFDEIFYKQDEIFTGGENHIVFVLDVSQSMNVPDINNESRLAGAKRKIVSLMQQNPGYDFALNIFAGESQRVLPFTQDISLFGTFLLGLDSKNLTLQGTNIESALLDASESFHKEETGSVVVFTDGDEEKIQVSQEVQKILDDKKISLHIVGVGSEKGGYIPNKLYNGKRVLVPLNSEGLQRLSREIGGKYYNLQDTINFESKLHNNKVKDNSVASTLLLGFFAWMIYVGCVYMNLYYKNK